MRGTKKCDGKMFCLQELSTMRGSMKVMPPVFSSQNVIAITMKCAWMIHTSFAIMGLFFHKISVTFNTLLQMLSKVLYTSVVKFPASTLEHIMKTFSSLSSAKWHPHSAFFTGLNRW
jgi:hypothetical protein